MALIASIRFQAINTALSLDKGFLFLLILKIYEAPPPAFYSEHVGVGVQYV